MPLDPQPETSAHAGRAGTYVDDRPDRRTPLALAAAVLITSGAVLRWLATGTVAGISVTSIGTVAMAVGLAFLLVALVGTRAGRRAGRSTADRRRSGDRLRGQP